MRTEFLSGRVTLMCADSSQAIATLEDESIDSVVTDPPYALTFMGKAWDTGDVAFDPSFWKEVLRILKPGGHLLAFSGTRTYHRMACAIEDAGFEIRDQIGWAYGTGFPKSHDVSKAIDKAVGATREKIAIGAPVKRMIPGADQNGNGSWIKDNGRVYQPGKEIPATDEAAAWEGWGTALKPAWEPIVVARKPLIGTVAENVLKHGTGALNIDGCRIEAAGRPLLELDAKATASNVYAGRTGEGGLGKGLDGGSKAVGTTDQGRWPANIILSVPEDEYQLRRHVTPEEKSELYRWLSENP
jgi:site-specific DNA-methyltransferase (adenine-specific)